ncbi:hypothetical protein B0H19DRAFT_1277124 [Mycena capillaripes]|nr:hypothetical protein B0H19DRAFT_1277124 [Mycena capillaripes]
MSSEAAELFTIRDVYLNTTLVQILFHGIYVVIFFLALFGMILKRKTPPILFAVVVTMFSIATVQLGLNWKTIWDAFVAKGDTPEDTVRTLTQQSLAITIVDPTLLVVNTVLADCVIIFRCFAVWNRDWRVIVLPVLTTLGSTGLGILTVFETVRFSETGADPNTFVDYARPYFCLCLATTLVATFLIVFRILRVSHGNSGLGFSGYRGVIEMVVESAFLYSANLVVYIALLYGSETTDNDGYAQAVLIEITGIAPTLIVARVSFGLSRPNTSWQREIKPSFPPTNVTDSTADTIKFSRNGDLESNSAMEKRLTLTLANWVTLGGAAGHCNTAFDLAFIVVPNADKPIASAGVDAVSTFARLRPNAAASCAPMHASSIGCACGAGCGWDTWA